MAGMRAKTSEIPQAVVLIANAPPIPGLGATGGFKYEIQDLNDQGIEALTKAVENFIGEARKRPELTRVYTTFNPAVPQRYLEVDRTKAKTRKVSITDIFDTLQINLGSLYVNEFNKYAGSTGCTFRLSQTPAPMKPTLAVSKFATPTVK